MEGFNKTEIENLLSKPLKVIPDFRGSFIKLGTPPLYVEENISMSHRKTLRGIHYETEGCRTFTPIYGRLYVVFLDLQDNSSSKDDWFSLTIDESNRQTFRIPPYVGCGFLVLSDLVTIHYKWQLKYDQGRQRTIRFDNPLYNIYWPGDHEDFILSERDYYVDENLIR